VHLIWHLLRARLRGEDGYTLVAVMGIMAAVSALSVAAFAAADGDLASSADDKQRKQAYAAAEAGVNDYLSRLTADPEYWRDCDDPDNPSLSLAGETGRQWRRLEGTTSDYSVELLPANDQPACSTADPAGTFIDEATGTFRVRSTGRTSETGGQRRSIIATFKRKGFLDYIYYTDLETTDPVWYRATSRTG